jgi:uncharacterized repeat protein (TIGR02543 family)
MKKILTFIIIIAMTLSLGVPAFAATPATVTVASPAAAVNPGSTVDVAVTIADNPGMDVMKLKFSYDTAALTLKDIELGSVMTGTFTKNLDKAVALLEAAGTTNATGNGTLVTLKFEVKSTATTGNYTIGFLVADAVNRNEERVALTTQAGTVSVAVPVTTYTVRFNANGGTGTMADVTGVPAGAYTLPANGFTAPAGKQFKGWSTGASGAVIEGTTYNVTGDVTLYAIWENKPHTHTYSTEWSTDSANHWHECTCGDKKDLAPHVDANNDHNCDVCGWKMSDHTGGTATCKDKATCTICGQKYGELAAHNYKTEWSTDETNHWHECSVCGDKKDEAAHIPGAAATETTPQTCTICGYVIKAALGHTHNFNQKNTSETYLKSAATCTKKAVYYYSCTCGEKGTETFESGELAAHAYKTTWSNDNASHWHSCYVCGDKKDEEVHIDKNKDHNCDVCGKKMTDHTGGTATCKDRATCSICGEKYGSLAGHVYKTIWSYDETNHWHECSVCGSKKDEEAHIPGEEATETTHQTCTVCGYVIKAAIGHVHSYTEKNTDEKYLKTPATCTAKAVYYYSCSCGNKGTETFESGDMLAHSWGTVWVSDVSKHWHECTVCKTKGDEADHAFEWKIDKEATVTEAGAKHEECKICGYNKTAVAIDKLAPSITDGSNAKWGKGDENGLTFKSDAAFSDFVEVLVDGKTVAAENYEKREGSIVIQLKASYLATLAAGEHTLTIRSASGDATTKFTIEAEVVPPAPESTNAWVWIVVGVVALGACAAVVVFIIRKRKNA